MQAGCSGVSGPILLSIPGEEATKTSTRQGNRTGYAKYSLHRLVIQLPLTIGSSFRDLIHKERVGDILGIVQRHGFLNVGYRDFLHTVAIVEVGLVNNLAKFKRLFLA